MTEGDLQSGWTSNSDAIEMSFMGIGIGVRGVRHRGPDSVISS
jgi:hypothetical protein